MSPLVVSIVLMGVKSKYNVAAIPGVNPVATMTIGVPGGPLMALLAS